METKKITMKKIAFLIAFIAMVTPGLIIAQTNNWTGATNSYWNNSGNWSLGHIPTSSENVNIPTGTINPRIQLGNAVCNNLTIGTGSAIKLYGKTMTLNGDLNVYGEVRLLDDVSVLNVYGNVYMRSGSTALVTAGQAKINAYGQWNFYSGSNANFNNGFVDFKGAGTALIICNSSNASFYKIRVYKTVRFSDYSSNDLYINNFVFISSGCNFESDADKDIHIKGNFNYYGNFDFTKNSNTGTVIFDDASLNKYSSGSGIFNNIEFNSGTGKGVTSTNADITVKGNLSISSGYFDCGNNDVVLYGNWHNTVGTTGFIAGTGTVTFSALSGTQNIYGYSAFNDVVVVEGTTTHVVSNYAPLTMHNLLLNDLFLVHAGGLDVTGLLDMDNVSSHLQLDNSSVVNINSLDQGGVINCFSAGGTININDLVENGIFGTYGTGAGTLNISQNSGGYLDFSGSLIISGGTVNIIGSGLSHWPLSANASINMSGGVLDMTDLTIKIYNGPYTFYDNITGGTIRTSRGFLSYRTDFHPTAGTFEFYGTSDMSLYQVNGSSLYNVIIDKSTKAGGKSNTVSLNTDFEISNDLDVTSGTFDLVNNDLTVGNELTIGSDASLIIRDNSLTVGNTVTIFGELEMLHTNSVFNAMSSVGWMYGSSANITAYNAKINVYGNWIFNNGANVNLNNGFVDFKGDSDNWIINYSSNSSFSRLRCFKSPGAVVKVSGNSTEDLVINHFLYIANGVTMENWSDHNIELTGNFNYYGTFDFTKGSNGSSFVFNGSDINQYSAGSGIFNNVIFNSLGSTTNHDITIAGDLTVSGGSFDCNDHTVFVGGDWTNNVGDAGFIEGNGLVVFNGATPADINTDETFYNLTVDKSYTGINGLELDNGITVNVKSHLQITDGTLEMNDYSSLNIDGNLSIGAGNGLNADDTGATIYIAGQWTDDNGTISTTHGFYPGNSTVIFDGTVNQVVYAAASEEKFGYVLIEKPSGAFKPNSNIYINMDIAVNFGTWADNVNGLSHYIERSFIVNSNGYFDVSTNKNTINLISDKDADINFSPSSGILNALVIDKSSVKGSSNSGKDGSKSQSVNFNSNIFCGYNADVSIQNATVNLGGHTFTSTGDLDINSGGVLNVDAGATLKIDQNNDLRINNGGTINVIGGAANYAKVTHYNPGRYDFFVNSGGTIAAERAIFEYMSDFGVSIMPGGIINSSKAFNDCIFRNGNTTYSSVYIVLNGSNSFTAHNTVFEENGSMSRNVSKATNTGIATFQSASGDLAGPEYEYDTYDRVFWTDIDVNLYLAAYLEGPFNGSGMNTDLKNKNLIPLSQPFNTSPWNYNGSEAVTSIPANVVDWVLIELRDASDVSNANEGTVVETRAAFLLNDGKICDLNGVSILQCTVSYDEKLYPVVIHRNHLAVISATRLVRDNDNYSYDFTVSGAAYGGAAGQKELSAGVWGMYGGDVSGSNVVSQYDINIWEMSAGTSDYSGNDMNMDGQTDNSDKNDLAIPNLGKSSQVPGAKK